MLNNLRARALLMISFAITAGLLAGYLVYEGVVKTDSDSVATTSIAEISRYPIVRSDSSLYTLPLPELTERSDTVVIATLNRVGEPYRIPAGDSLTSIVADWEVSVERYVKGQGDDSLTFRKSIALEDSFRGVTAQFDTRGALQPGVRYVLFLGSSEDGSLGPLAEPFRFRVEADLVFAETTMGREFPNYERDEAWDAFFPPVSEDAFVAEIESLSAR